MSRVSFATIQARASRPYLSSWVRRRQVDRGQLFRNLLAEVVAPLDRLDLVHVQRAAHDEPHLAAVGDQPFDAPGRQDQGVGREIAGRAVVLGGTRKGRNVEQPDKIAVLMAVAGLPRMGGKEGDIGRVHDRASCLRSFVGQAFPPDGMVEESGKKA